MLRNYAKLRAALGNASKTQSAESLLEATVGMIRAHCIKQDPAVDVEWPSPVSSPATAIVPQVAQARLATVCRRQIVPVAAHAAQTSDPQDGLERALHTCAPKRRPVAAQASLVAQQARPVAAAVPLTAPRAQPQVGAAEDEEIYDDQAEICEDTFGEDVEDLIEDDMEMAEDADVAEDVDGDSDASGSEDSGTQRNGQ